MTRPASLLVLAAALLVGQDALAATRAASRAAARGRTIAAAHCAGCHAIGPKGASPNPLAPPFRDLHQHFPVADMVGALAEGARPRHPAMPRFKLNFRQGRDLVAYVQSVQAVER